MKQHTNGVKTFDGKDKYDEVETIKAFNQNFEILCKEIEILKQKVAELEGKPVIINK